ncbi:hypothetical protein [Mycolicibacterium sarraceniae]|uniref:Uncharacterized protein n=1 Tax=Mycolicibacterium sarraceniae TaxID=1534348 RepID=A0A7I7SQD6_9MYCO|nr:hypothetical protein [Mycolicibacterium sarraceniae]BBY58800.1 hypothetical protein MSAR_19360 [Mycolicibacterium sarraceniae]
MNAPRYDEIVELLGQVNAAPSPVAAQVPADETTASDILAVESIVLAGTATTRDGAISEVGRLLVACGVHGHVFPQGLPSRNSPGSGAAAVSVANR